MEGKEKVHLQILQRLLPSSLLRILSAFGEAGRYEIVTRSTDDAGRRYSARVDRVWPLGAAKGSVFHRNARSSQVPSNIQSSFCRFFYRVCYPLRAPPFFR